MISSYTDYVCTVPDTTEIHGEFWGRHDDTFHAYVFEDNGESGYSDNVLSELIETFGKPLDEVPGLELDCHYETNDVDEGFFGCNLQIHDGRCEYSESFIGYRDAPMSECPISIGHGEV